MGRPKGSKNKHHVPKAKLVCRQCGKKFERYPSQITNPDRVFCSQSCQSRWTAPYRCHRGPAHHAWKGKNYRAIALAEKGARCEICGYSSHPRLIHVHHRDFGRDNHSIENLAVLCIRCHYETHLESSHPLSEPSAESLHVGKSPGGGTGVDG